jgi:adenylate cyclase
VALFFSDLSDSTAMYAKRGDAAAFKVVQDHFDALTAVLEQHGGCLVKTIGDAVMASFDDELTGLRAAIEILQRFHQLEQDDPRFTGVTVKLGLHAGSCYVVTANGVLDYFGQTVNMAARIQGKAAARELIVSQDLADRGVREGVIRAELVGEKFTATLKGVDGEIRLVRLHPVPQTPSPG